jgi:hypothetical protein
MEIGQQATIKDNTALMLQRKLTEVINIQRSYICQVAGGYFHIPGIEFTEGNMEVKLMYHWVLNCIRNHN